MSLSQKLDDLLSAIREENERLEGQASAIVEARQAKEQEARDAFNARLQEIRQEAADKLAVIAEERKLVGAVVRATQAKPVKAKRTVAGVPGKSHAPTGVTTQRTVLSVLANNSAAMSAPAVSRICGIGQTTVNRAMVDLRSEGLVRPAGRRRDPDDTRRGGRHPQSWAITPDGMEFLGRDSELTLVA